MFLKGVTLMSDKIFTAKWIAPDNCTNLPVLRKSFNIDNSFEKAEIFISGLGIFEMHINTRAYIICLHK